MVKSYICVFICFVTKDVHLELVGNLSTNAFLGVLRRFKSRREMCSILYSDNSINFFGANCQLKGYLSKKHTK